MCEYRRNGVHIRPAGHIDGKAAVLLRDLFGNIGYSAHDWPGKISFGGAANPWDTNFYQNCKISVIVTGSLSGYKPKYSPLPLQTRRVVRPLGNLLGKSLNLTLPATSRKDVR